MKKEINRLNRCQVIAISYYKYAPESFKAYVKTSSPNNPNVSNHQEIFLDHNMRSIIAMKFIQGQNKEGLDELKKIVRRERKKNSVYFTIGFRMVDDPKRYAYVSQLVYPIGQKNKDTLKFIYQEITKFFKQNDWKMQESKSADIVPTRNGVKTENVRTTYININKNAPIYITGQAG